MENDILSRKEAARFLGVCIATLDRLDIPKLRIRKRVMFKKQTLLRWVDLNIKNQKKEFGND